LVEPYSRRSFLAGVLTAGMLTTAGGYLFTRRESIKLTLVTGADPTGGARQLLVTMWNKLNPDTQIAVQEINSSTQDQFEKFNSVPADMFNLDVIHIPRFVQEGKIVAFDPENEISLLDQVERVCRVPGSSHFWAAPWNTDVGMMYQRITDKTATSEPPTLRTVDAAGRGRFVGQLDTVGQQTDEAFVVNVLEHALAQDDLIIDAAGVPSYGLGQWQAALRPLAAALKAKRLVTEAGEADTNRTFQRQNLASMRDWPVYYPQIDRDERTKPSTAEIRLGVLPVGILGGQGLAISAKCKHRSEAIRAAHFLTDTPAQKLLASFGFAPTGVDAYIDAELQASMPQLTTIRNAVEHSRPRPMHPNYAAFSRVFVDYTYRYLHKGEQLTQRFVDDLHGSVQ
jgi:multiple sugar transport system substrate-binding protein